MDAGNSSIKDIIKVIFSVNSVDRVQSVIFDTLCSKDTHVTDKMFDRYDRLERNFSVSGNENAT